MATTIEMLECACSHIQQLDFKAGDSDRSTAAFETFRRSVTRIMRGACTNEHCILESIEPKRQYFGFLLDFAERCFLHRRRVGEVLKCLLDAPSWHEAARADPDMWTALQDLICECQLFRANAGHGKRALGPSVLAEGGQPNANVAFDRELVILADQRVPPVSASVATEREQAIFADRREPSTSKRTAEAGNPFSPEFAKEEVALTPPKKICATSVGLREPMPTKTSAVLPAVTPAKTVATTFRQNDVPQASRQSNLSSNPFKTSSPASPRAKVSSNPFATLLTSRNKRMDDRICCAHNPFASSPSCARVK